MSSKLNNTDIERAAKQHLQGIADDLQHGLMGACLPHDEMDDIERYIIDAFSVGAQWGAQRIIKGIWHEASEEPPRYDDYLVKTKRDCIGTANYNMLGWYKPNIVGGDVEYWLDIADIKPKTWKQE